MASATIVIEGFEFPMYISFEAEDAEEAFELAEEEGWVLIEEDEQDLAWDALSEKIVTGATEH